MKFIFILIFALIASFSFSSKFPEFEIAIKKLYSNDNICFKTDIYSFSNNDSNGTLIKSCFKQKKNNISYMNFFETEFLITGKEIIIVNNKTKQISRNKITNNDLKLDSDNIQNFNLNKTDSIILIIKDEKFIKYKVFDVLDKDSPIIEVMIDPIKLVVMEITYDYSNSILQNIHSMNKLNIKYSYDIKNVIPKNALKRKRYLKYRNGKWNVSKKFNGYKLITTL